MLLRLASDARFFRSSDGRLFAQVRVGSRLEIFGLKSTAFRDWLIEGHFADRHDIPSQWAVRRVLTALERVHGRGNHPRSLFALAMTARATPPHFISTWEIPAVERSRSGTGVVGR